MKRDARSFLWDIKRAADAILKYLKEMEFEDYAASDLVQAAVERKFEIVGEALNQLNKHYPAIAARIPDYREVIAFRNVLIHGYATVEHQRVWRIAAESLPALRSAAAAILDELGAAKE